MSGTETTHRGPPALDDTDFARIARLALAEAGLALSESKRNMIAARVAKRLRATGHESVAAYLDAVEADNGLAERQNLICALTTNVSHFFREQHHFDILAKDVLVRLADRARAGGRIRFWSAGCSTGQEPYSIAMTIRETLGEGPGRNIRILASDIDGTVLDHARRGIYSERQLQGLSPERRKRHFRPAEGPDDSFEVDPALREMVAFRHLNLIADWPIKGPFDAIFCRNVVIYFDSETQARLWPRFAGLLAPGGVLFIGHSERLIPEVAARLSSAGITAFRRPEKTARVDAGPSNSRDVA